jgi:DNA-binding transcriptional ArsR family regulator
VLPNAAEEPDPWDALGDPQRRAILRLLGEGERSVGDLAADLPISRPAVSRHLRVLREAGLVREEPRGTRRIYALQAEGPEAVRAYLEQVWGEAAARFRLTAENTREGPR